MSTFLLAWNPKRWAWTDLATVAQQVKNGQTVNLTWGCGTSQQLQAGDRAFFIRLGVAPRGIFAAGHIRKSAYPDSPWDESKAHTSRVGFAVEVTLETLLDPAVDTILPRALLNAPPFAAMHWDTRMSGVRIPAEVAAELEKVWAGFAKK